MDKFLRSNLIFIVLAVLVLTGCRESTQNSSSERQSRLVASENLELNNQIESLKAQIVSLKTKLDQCHKQQEDNIKRTSDFLTVALSETEKKNQRIVKENNELKEQIAQLQTELDELKSLSSNQSW